MLVADDSDIKMLARGNPAVVYVEQGVIRWKRALGSISAESLHDDMLTIDSLSNDMNPNGYLKRVALYYVLTLVVILVLNRTHLLVRPLFSRKPKTSDSDSATSKETQNINSQNQEE
jgi:hypothetical protein